VISVIMGMVFVTVASFCRETRNLLTEQ